MAMSEPITISTKAHDLHLRVYKGHFATGRSHTNYYIDITNQKSSLSEAKAVAKALAGEYKSSTMIDTILCLDDTQVIGTCLADELTKNDFHSINAGGSICILTPEFTTGNQIFFRDNILPMVKSRKVLILMASVATGATARSAIEAVTYYSGDVVGIASVFATVSACQGVPVCSVFDPYDLPGYVCSSSVDCPFCRKGEKLEALINSFGFSKL